MHIPPRAERRLHRLLTWSQAAGLVLVPNDAGTLDVVGDLAVPGDVRRVMGEVGTIAADALRDLEIASPVVAQTVLWWELSALQLTPEARALLPLATQTRRRRLQALRAVHLAAMADVTMAIVFPPST